MLRLPPFTYYAPRTLRQALKMKADAGPDGMYVAGGTDLYPNMKRRQQEPKVVISLAGIRALRRVTGGKAQGGMSVGAGITLTELHTHRKVVRRYPALAHAAEAVSTPPLRNMGTFGGNLCLDTRCNYYNQSYEWRKAVDFCMKKDGSICWVARSSPRCWAVNSSDTAPVAMALGAEFVLVGPDGDERIVPAARFFNDDGINHLTKRPHEILTDVRLPPTDGWNCTYWKLRRRGAFDFPVLGVAAWVRWDGRMVAEARIVLGGVGSRPQVVPQAGEAIVGTELDAAAVGAAAQAAFRPSKPMDNTDFGLAWRKQMTRVYVTRALEQLRGSRR